MATLHLSQQNIEVSEDESWSSVTDDDNSNAEEDQYLEEELEYITDDDDDDNSIEEESVTEDGIQVDVVMSGKASSVNCTGEDNEWKTTVPSMSTGALKPSSEVVKTNSNGNVGILNLESPMQRCSSERNLSNPPVHKRRLSLDLIESIEDDDVQTETTSIEPPVSNSFFRAIGNWFRGSKRSTQSGSSDTSSTQNKENVETPKIDSTKSILKTEPSVNRYRPQVGTSFTSYIPGPVPSNAPKKMLRFSESSLTSSDSEYESGSSDDEESEISSTESSSVSVFASGLVHLSQKKSSDLRNKHLHPHCDVTYQLRSDNDSQCLAWQRNFRKLPGIEIVYKDLHDNLVADAMIIPGNSFGFLDGEPEIQYAELLGWDLQEHIRRKLLDDHDGELLVGQAVLLPMSTANNTQSIKNDPSTGGDETITDGGWDRDNKDSKCKIGLDSDQNGTSEKEDGETHEIPIHDSAKDVSEEHKVSKQSSIAPDEEENIFCKTIKNIIYVPVMRVPMIVSDTVNAYLAFRAALLTVKSHNRKCEESAKIRTVICPPLCSSIGRMPPSRIALQMKTAYETFVLDTHHDLRIPVDLGRLASCHVQLSSAKNGNWC